MGSERSDGGAILSCKAAALKFEFAFALVFASAECPEATLGASGSPLLTVVFVAK